MKIIMLGTGDFAVPAFRALYQTSHQVLALYTQPDKTRAGKEVHPNAMKSTALEHGTRVLQPENINTPESLAELAEFGADVFLVAAYGQILSRAFLALPPRGAYNIHASLLPKYRGAAPINYAVLHGETETGVTLIEVVPKLDAGPMVGVVKTDIRADETAGELEIRLAELAAPLTCDFLDRLQTGPVVGVPQDPALVTLAPKMTKEMGLIPWEKSAAMVDCHVRGMQPWPTPYTFLHAGETTSDKPPRRVVIRAVKAIPESKALDINPEVEPGTIIAITKESFQVQTGDGIVEVHSIQPEGKKIQTAGEFLRGQRLAVGDYFAGM